MKEDLANFALHIMSALRPQYPHPITAMHIAGLPEVGNNRVTPP
jgi:hypothetical protein